MIRTGTNKRQLFIIALLTLSLFGCSSDEGELSRYINKIKGRPAKPIEPIPEFAPLPSYIYPEEVDRRSPFKPVEKKKMAEEAPNTNRPKQPLEAFPLDALKFVGTLREGYTSWALIQQPNGQIVRVRAGDYMGENFGLIVSIKEDVIKLQETVQIAGQWKKKTTILRLNVKD